jgi:hypothetical protein
LAKGEFIMAGDLTEVLKVLYEEFRIRGGEEKTMYCQSCGKATKHISVNFDDIGDIIKKKAELGAFGQAWMTGFQVLTRIPIYNWYVNTVYRIGLGKPYMCTVCGIPKFD